MRWGIFRRTIAAYKALNWRLYSTTADKQVYLETYGCQMNFNDSEIVLGILSSAGWTRTLQANEASLILLMTCAIREGAESKIWQRIDHFRALKSTLKYDHRITLGVLGCMAERLRERLLDRERRVDLVCGPDSYRNLAELVSIAQSKRTTMDVMLKMDETYADILPVRLDPTGKSAFVSIMRGCNNMCSFCIVPFVRGRERSRPVLSILREVTELQNQGIKEITLLGQNVNSYRGIVEENLPTQLSNEIGKKMTDGFRSIYKRREHENEISFTVLLDLLSQSFPSIRFRFTSPHPKDFPIELLELIKERGNICKCIHLPVQSGSTTVLDRMRRGYTRDDYLRLVDRITQTIPGVAITTDMIAGFCGESEQEHKDSLSLVRTVGYDMAYMFAYSMRPGTHAHRNYQDDVEESVKQERLRELLDLFYGLQHENSSKYLGTVQQVLVCSEPSKKDKTMCTGRSDTGRPCVFTPPKDKSVEMLEGEIVEMLVEKIQGGTLVGSLLPTSQS